MLCTIVSIVLASILTMQCSVNDDSVTKGGTIEIENPISAEDTTNSIEGVIYKSTGTPQAGVTVALYKQGPTAHLDTTTITTTTTNEDGHYRLIADSSGIYAILSKDSANSLMAFTQEIVHIDSGTTHISDTLTSPGWVQVIFDSSLQGVVYIQGTPFYQHLSGNDTIDFGLLPQGNYTTISHLSPDADSASIIFDSAFTILSDITYILNSQTILPYTCTIEEGIDCARPECDTVGTCGWDNRLTLTINTTATGAALTESVFQFPTLIRFDSTVFDFNTAQPTGADIRFSLDSIGLQELPFEITQWSPANKRAEIWVTLPYIAPDTIMPITVSWGNADVHAQSNGRSVFGQENSFVTVWHFDSLAPLVDATRSDTALSYGGEVHESIIGDAMHFYGNQYLTLPVTSFADISNQISFSAWIYTDPSLETQFSIAFRAIGSQGERIYNTHVPWSDNLIYWDAGPTGNIGTDEQGVNHYDRISVNSSPHIQFGEWNYYVFSKDAETDHMSVSINGIEHLTNSQAIHPMGAVAQFYIGMDSPDSNYFIGVIDEFRIESTVRSQAWIRLSYENQKKPNTLVQFPDL